MSAVDTIPTTFFSGLIIGIALKLPLESTRAISSILASGLD